MIFRSRPCTASDLRSVIVPKDCRPTANVVSGGGDVTVVIIDHADGAFGGVRRHIVCHTFYNPQLAARKDGSAYL